MREVMLLAHIVTNMRTVHLNWCRAISLVIILILFIQILTMGFLSYLNAEPPKPKPKILSNVDRAEKVFEAMRTRIDQENSVIDSTGEYRLFQNVWFGKKMNRDIVSEDIGIVTHTSVNNMHYLVNMARRWEGPMSVVIFAPGQDLIVALENILQLVWCVMAARTYGAFHIISPLNMPARDIKPYGTYDDLLECRFMEKRIKGTLSIENYGFKNLNYPNNIMRNFGMESSMTEYLYVLDVDLIPSAHTRANFLEFARNHNLMFTITPEKPDNVIYITPVFESEFDYDIPDTKSILKRKYNRTVRQFYIEPCPRCQSSTNYNKWILQLKSTVLDVSYTVEWQSPYEPFYIVHRSVPQYNTGFKQYGFNRISQMCELHVAGYKMNILNNAFLVHIGYKLPNKFHDTKTQELKANKARYLQFIDELKLRYPNSSKTC